MSKVFSGFMVLAIAAGGMSIGTGIGGERCGDM
jgi:hypothetical protein